MYVEGLKNGVRKSLVNGKHKKDDEEQSTPAFVGEIEEES